MNDTIITTSWDDGHPLDLKVANLLSKHRLSGTFYMPLVNKENSLMSKEEMKSISKKFEVGGHTINHVSLPEIPEENLELEISQGKEKMEEICGQIISFAYPKGQYNQNVIQVVKKSGFRGARTAKMLHYRFTNSFEYHPTIHAVNRSVLSKGKQTLTSVDKDLSLYLITSGIILKDWEIIAKKSLDFILEHGGIWHMWGHSWEINNNNDWEKLEKVLHYANETGKQFGAEFLTNGEVFEHFS